MTVLTAFHGSFVLFFPALNLSMGSPGCNAHSPLYISHCHHTDTRMAWMDEDVKPPRSLLGLPELSWPGVYLPYCERLAIEENPWMLRMTEPPTPAALPSSPAKPTQVQDPPTGMEGQVEERCLEQVQTMVVGEVLKDVDTACKLLNIASGRRNAAGKCHIMNTVSEKKTCVGIGWTLTK